MKAREEGVFSWKVFPKLSLKSPRTSGRVYCLLISLVHNHVQDELHYPHSFFFFSIHLFLEKEREREHTHMCGSRGGAETENLNQASLTAWTPAWGSTS